MFKKLKEEAIARGLTESPVEKALRNNNANAAEQSPPPELVNMNSSKTDLLVFIRSQTAAAAKMKDKLTSK